MDADNLFNYKYEDVVKELYPNYSKVKKEVSCTRKSFTDKVFVIPTAHLGFNARERNIIMYRLQGVKMQEIANIVGVNHSTVFYVMKRYYSVIKYGNKKQIQTIK